MADQRSRTPDGTTADRTGTSTDGQGDDGQGNDGRGEDGQASDGLRSDARRNRERILAAAREAFDAHGIDAPLTAVARRAGVGPATLYRHFPTRAALVTEAFRQQLDHCHRLIEEAVTDPDPWRGLCTVVHAVTEVRAVHRGCAAAFHTRFPGAVDFNAERDRAEAHLAKLVSRCRQAGVLRPDFDLSDLSLLFLAQHGVATGPPEVALTATRRLVGYLLQGFRAEGAPALPPPAPLRLDQVHGVAAPG